MRQDVLYTSTPECETAYGAAEMPCWVDHGYGAYGTPSVEGYGVKAAIVWQEKVIDLDDDERVVDAAGKQPKLVGCSDRPYGSATQPANRGACLVVPHRESKRPARLQYANITRMYLLTYSKQARKTLARVPAHVSSRILARMKKIASNPFAPDNNAESMRGMHGYFRLRSGDWRVVYKVETDVLRIVVVKIAPRGGAYE